MPQEMLLSVGVLFSIYGVIGDSTPNFNKQPPVLNGRDAPTKP
jgi:hypothetical protein